MLLNDTATGESSSSSSSCGVKIFGSGAANTSISSLSQNTGNLSIGAALTFGSKKQNIVYGMYNAHAANSSDTAVIAKTFLFPEIGKRIFTIGYLRDYVSSKNENIHFVPMIEFSENKLSVTKDSTTQNINTFSTTFGYRIEWHNDKVHFGDTTVSFIFSVMPYYNMISVDSKYFNQHTDAYNSMFNDTHLPPTFHTVGFEAVLQLSKFQIFANLKWVLNDKQVSDANIDLKGNSIVIGTIVSADFLNFGN